MVHCDYFQGRSWYHGHVYFLLSSENFLKLCFRLRNKLPVQHTILFLKASSFLLFANQLYTRTSVTRLAPRPSAFSAGTPLLRHSTLLHSRTRFSLSSFEGFFCWENAFWRTFWLAGPHRNLFRLLFFSFGFAFALLFKFEFVFGSSICTVIFDARSPASAKFLSTSRLFFYLVSDRTYPVYNNGIFLRKFDPNLSWVTRTKCKMWDLP